MISKIALGTAQFGQNYGIANSSGQVSEDEARSMIDLARDAKIDTLDTAVAYGDAERLLGEIGVTDFRVVSKVPTPPDSTKSVYSWLHEEVEASLYRLRLSRLYGLMLHDADLLAGPWADEVSLALHDLRELGLVERIGVSIYRPSQLPVVMQRLSPDLIQAPMNVFDRRLANSGWLDRLCASGIEVHIRSVFLQGLLLLPHDKTGPRFERWHPLFTAWENWVNEVNLSKINACLSHVLSYEGISRVVLGFDSVSQLREVIENSSFPSFLAPVALAVDDELLIHPGTWSST